MFQEQIDDYIKNHSVFFINEIQDHLAVNTEKKAIFNTELSRIEKKEKIKRLAHGVYAVPVQSCFGQTLPNEHVIAKHVYIDNGNGYVTGPSFLNQIGVSTWIPQKTYIKTNNAKKNLSLRTFYVYQSRVKISEENKKYLQLLDGIADLSQYATDNPEINKIFYEFIIENGLNTTKLLLMGHKLYNRTVQNKLYEILEENYETA